MACLSTSLVDVVKKSDAARAQIDILQEGLNKSDATYKKIFEKKRDEFFQNANLDDIVNGEVSQNIKVEFASEFSLDKIIPVVQAAINAAVAVYNPGKVIEDNTKKAFSDLVVAIGECAKFSSSATSSMSFASNRLSPGLFVSLYAASATIKDSNMFGSKAVTATMYYYQLSKSNKDIEIDMMRELTLMYAEGVINLNKKILDLAGQVADGTMTIEVFNERKATIKSLIDQMKPTLLTYKSQNPKYNQLVANMVEKEKKNANMNLLQNSKFKNLRSTKSTLGFDKLFKEYHVILTEL